MTWPHLLMNKLIGNPLVVQCLGLHAFTAEGLGLIPSQGTKIPKAIQHDTPKMLINDLVNRLMTFVTKRGHVFRLLLAQCLWFRVAYGKHT